MLCNGCGLTSCLIHGLLRCIFRFPPCSRYQCDSYPRGEETEPTVPQPREWVSRESQTGCLVVQRPPSRPLGHTASMLIGPSVLPTTTELSFFTVQFSLLQTADFLPFFSLSANDCASDLQRKQKPSDQGSCSLATRCVNLPASLFRAALWHNVIASKSEKGTTIR